MSDRLDSVDRIRTHQRAWLEATRLSATSGRPMAICNSDECEEIFTAMGIPVLVINYWNTLVGMDAARRTHYQSVLAERGFPSTDPFALGLAATLDPSQAPWGGLPRPAVIIGAGRDEVQRRITELWARAAECPCVPLDFNFAEAYAHRPERWWERLFDEGEALVDQDRLALRVEQLRELGDILAPSGNSLENDELAILLDAVNAQMRIWIEARDLMAAARPSPVSLRDQMAVYQMMWARGSKTNIDLISSYRDEVAARVRDGRAAYPETRHRIFLASMGGDPAFHAHLRERHGAAIVANLYSAMPSLYARRVNRAEPLRTLAARQLFLFRRDAQWMLEEAQRWGADAIIAIDPLVNAEGELAGLAEASGLPFLALDTPADTPAVREALARFAETRLTP